MQVLFIGDIFGSPGRKIVHDHLHHVVKTNEVDLVIANAENAADGF
jgi:2',3'-cyclic-nucleotide 2'-phosphodiesterase